MTAFTIEDVRGSRNLQAGDFPLSLGGPQADVQLPGVNGAEPLAYLGISEGDLFVQPGAAGARIVCNGTPIVASHWLHGGDLLVVGPARVAVEAGGDSTRLRVEEPSGDDGTEPPIVLTPPPRIGDGGTRPPTVQARPTATVGETPAVRPVEFQPRRAGASRKTRRAFRPGAALLWIVLLLLAGAAFFLFTARSVLVEIEPEPERLALTGGLFHFELGGRYLLRPGDYALTAGRVGYRPLEASFEVTADARQSFRFELEKLPGRLALSVRSVGGEAVDGATVLLDGEAVGTTPLEALELAPGEYHVRIEAERYGVYESPAEIEGAGTTSTLVVELEPGWADVGFDSEPRGAAVRVDGEAVGTTPLTAEVLAGRHAIELRLQGHKPYLRNIQVEAGEPQSVPVARLQPSDGNLVIASDPPGATVTVDGTFRGQTPLDLFLAPGRTYEVGVTKAGYGSDATEVAVRSGQTDEIAFELEAVEGEVVVSSWPPDAELFVDGESRGRAQQTLRLPALEHEIEIKKAGFITHRRKVTPLPGIPQSIVVTLETVEQAEKANTPPARTDVLEITGGHVLRLIQPGRFQMGASRREPGRRANETLREIELTRPFYLGTMEVSNQQFKSWNKEHSSGFVVGQTLDGDDQPVVQVTWEEAAAYCNWLSEQDSLPAAYVRRDGELVAAEPMTLGYRLPTEAEWAWVARYPDGAEPVKYPWGESLPVKTGSGGNYADVSASNILPGVIVGYNDKYTATAPVSSFEPSVRGIYNLGGNVAEWVHDYYAIQSTGGGLESDPFGPEEGELHVIRGSSWMYSTVTELRLTYRDYGDKPRPDLGFRIARYVE